MTLTPDYLEYSRRRYGMDHDLYPWSNMFSRPAVDWPNGARVAVVVVVSLEWFPITPADKPFRAPGHMQTPYPDYRHYTSRDYGVRVGLDRLLGVFARHGVRISVAMNSAVATRSPSIVSDLGEAGHEIIAHATDMNATIASGVPEEDERSIIAGALQELAAAGVRPRGWMSIARSQSWNTPRLLAEAGLSYMCDWVNDELPYTMSTSSGAIANLPINHELSDRQILNVQQQSIDSYCEQVRDAHAWLDGEARTHGGRMLPLHITPYIMGLPYRIDAFDALIGWLAAREGVWFATGSDIIDMARR